MDSVLATQVREFEMLKTEESEHVMEAFKKGEKATKGMVDKWKKRVFDFKGIEEELNKNILRLKKDLTQRQDTIDAQEKEIAKLCEPPDMSGMRKTIRDLSNYLDDASTIHNN